MEFIITLTTDQIWRILEGNGSYWQDLEALRTKLRLPGEDVLLSENGSAALVECQTYYEQEGRSLIGEIFEGVRGLNREYGIPVIVDELLFANLLTGLRMGIDALPEHWRDEDDYQHLFYHGCSLFLAGERLAQLEWTVEFLHLPMEALDFCNMVLLSVFAVTQGKRSILSQLRVHPGEIRDGHQTCLVFGEDVYQRRGSYVHVNWQLEVPVAWEKAPLLRAIQMHFRSLTGIADHRFAWRKAADADADGAAGQSVIDEFFRRTSAAAAPSAKGQSDGSDHQSSASQEVPESALKRILLSKEIMRAHLTYYNPLTAEIIIRAIPEARSEWDELGGRWGPGMISAKCDPYVNAVTVGRYLGAFWKAGVRTMDGVPIPYRPRKAQPG